MISRTCTTPWRRLLSQRWLRTFRGVRLEILLGIGGYFTWYGRAQIAIGMYGSLSAAKRAGEREVIKRQNRARR